MNNKTNREFQIIVYYLFCYMCVTSCRWYNTLVKLIANTEFVTYRFSFFFFNKPFVKRNYFLHCALEQIMELEKAFKTSWIYDCIPIYISTVFHPSVCYVALDDSYTRVKEKNMFWCSEFHNSLNHENGGFYYPHMPDKREFTVYHQQFNPLCMRYADQNINIWFQS
jgi:hypothetical protein